MSDIRTTARDFVTYRMVDSQGRPVTLKEGNIILFHPERGEISIHENDSPNAAVYRFYIMGNLPSHSFTKITVGFLKNQDHFFEFASILSATHGLTAERIEWGGGWVAARVKGFY